MNRCSIGFPLPRNASASAPLDLAVEHDAAAAWSRVSSPLWRYSIGCWRSTCFDSIASTTSFSLPKRSRLVGRLQLRDVDLRDVLAVDVHGVGEEVAAEDHVLGRRRQRPAVGRREDVLGGQHQIARFFASFVRERHVDRHLVTVEVGVKSGTHHRMDLNRLAFDELRLKAWIPRR